MTTPVAAQFPTEDLRELRSLPADVRRNQPPADDERAVVELLRRARAGDDRAWECLHDRFNPMLLGVARSYRLSANDVDDVVQTTWLRLLHHVARLREPAAVAGWLATTTRRECLRLLQLPLRESLAADPDMGCHAEYGDPERELLAAEVRAVLARAVATLPERHRQLMSLLVAQPTMDYQEVSTTLTMPIGSIGPIRARSIARLQRHHELRSLRACDG
jgi:RNA polymerase sigma factor (sigma-70 family)